ncbi:MAG: carboxylating nicotinate-nucleotide diphosphorylase [Brockia lithotrophica]|nr:carboxylating nicotinate-nucleotide diphosphorylase [Brockia lithotrophica]
MWTANPYVRRILVAVLEDDLGRADLTSWSAVPDVEAVAVVRAKQAGRVAGLPFAEILFRYLDPHVEVEALVREGADVGAQTEVLRLRGRAHAVLAAERTALNVLMRLSGIATRTRDLAARIAGSGVRLAATRKTAPGFGFFDKYAVAVGGGLPHRFGLDDGILLKDNHIALVGSIGEAVRRARAHFGPYRFLQVEVRNTDELEEALAAGVDGVLLDNFSPRSAREAVAHVRTRAPRVFVEISGGITPETLPEYAKARPDAISLGYLTHSAPALDLALDVVASE